VNEKSLITVYDPEMDMDRAIGFRASVKMSHMITAVLRWLVPSRIETPCRSVDRELEQFFSSWE
jgi:hypothetical protein